MVLGLSFSQEFYTGFAYEEEQRQRSAGADYVFPNILGRITKVSDGLNLRSNPGGDAAILKVLRPFEAVTIQSYTDGGWYKIRTRGGIEGYAASKYISLEALPQSKSKAYIYDAPGGKKVMSLEDLAHPQISEFFTQDSKGWFQLFQDRGPGLYLAYDEVSLDSADDIYIEGVPRIHQRGRDPISGKTLARGHVHCGPTAFQIVYHFYNKMLPRQKIVDQIYSPPGEWAGFEGGMIPRLAVEYSRELGFTHTHWDTSTKFLTLKKNLMEGRPQIVAVIGQIYTYIDGKKESYFSVTGHHIVLKGIQANGDLIFSDPNRVTTEEFNNIESDFKDAAGRSFDAVMRSDDFFRAWTEDGQAWSYDLKKSEGSKTFYQSYFSP